MKRFGWVISFALILALALPLWADTHTWNNGAADGNFNTNGNWEEGSPPADTDTIDISDETAPTTNRPTAGKTFHFNITHALNAVVISDWLDGAAIGNVTVNHADAMVYSGTNVSGNVIVSAGIWTPGTTETTVGTTTVASGASFWPSNATSTGLVTINPGGVLMVWNTFTANGGVSLGGTLQMGTVPAVLDSASPILITADGAVIDWAYLDIFGGLNANGKAVTHSNTTDAVLTCDQAGTLDLGTTTANSIAVTNTAAVTIGNSFACGGFNVQGNVTGGGFTITVGAGGFTYTSGTLTPSLDITVGATTTVAVWNNAANKFRTLTANASTTLSGHVRCKAVAGSGAIVTASGKSLLLSPAANDFWTYTGALSGAGFVQISLPSDLSNTVASIATSNVALYVSSGVGATALTLTANAVSTGTAALTVDGSAGTIGGLSVANLTSGAITLGGAATSGVLTLRPGVHVITGALSKSGTGTANAFNPQGRIYLGGTFTGTGIVVTPSQEGAIDCQGVGKVTAVVASGNRLVVRRAIHSSTGIPLRSWEADGCTNTRFLGRRTIGGGDLN